MFTKQSISLLIIPALITLPTGIARADTIQVETDDQKVTIERDRGISIESGSREITIPQEAPASISRHPNQHLSPSQIFSLPLPRKLIRCQERNYSHQDTQTHNSGGGVTYIQSSVSTRTCQ
jgi:hypothetical protein